MAIDIRKESLWNRYTKQSWSLWWIHYKEFFDEDPINQNGSTEFSIKTKLGMRVIYFNIFM